MIRQGGGGWGVNVSILKIDILPPFFLNVF